ncbi:MAG: hypothetical protein Q7T03_01760 [Deltaproteobacteria bacterium]|nr:hypothetical protein [Deltaproteobacteria bacterium]
MWPIVAGIAVLAWLTDCATPSKVQKKKLSKAEQKEDKPHWKNKTTFTIKGSCWKTMQAAKRQADGFALAKAVKWWFAKTSEGKACNQKSVIIETHTKTSHNRSREDPEVRISGLAVNLHHFGTCSNGDYRAIVEVNLAGAEFMCMP